MGWGIAWAIIKVECCVYIPDLSENVSTALEDMQNQVEAMSDKKYSLLDFGPILGKERLVENYCYCCHNHSNHTALWALLLKMSCKFCNPVVDSVLSCGWPEG